jgi:signal transduction histidine kinase
LATELLLTEERERRAIATELHDSIGQILAFSSIELGNMTKSSSTQATKGLKRVRKHIEQAITAMRTLTFNLSPPVLYTFGLEAAVEDLAEQSSKEHNFRCDFICGVNSMPMSNEVQVLLYRAVRELLANIAKHAMANTVKIALNRVDNMVKITIEDDGVGFDQGKAGDVSDELKGFGLFSIRERLSHFGGSFEIQSGLGRGTKVMLTAPLENEDENKNGD